MKRYLSLFSAGAFTIFGLLIFIIHYFTPIQSDDFSFFLFDYGDIGERYFSWTGRLVAEFIAISLMNIKNKFILSVVQTLGLLGLLYLISQMPSKIFNQKFNGFRFIIIASLYWLFHPDLGQSTFWVVGAAVYMWTGIIVYLYLCFLLKYYYSEGRKQNLLSFLLLFGLAFMAGCTNENVGPFIAVLSWLLFLVCLILEKTWDNNLFFSAIFSSVGAAVLIMAPGNQRRLEDWEMTSGVDWGEITIFQKYQQFDSHYVELLIIPFLILIAIYILIFAFGKFTIIKGKKISFLGLSILFLIFSLTANEILFLTPAKFVRAMSGPFLFLLFAISLSLFEFKNLEMEKRMNSYLTFSFAVIAIVFFLFLYFGKVFPLYKSYHEQHQVQLEIIHNAQKLGKKELKIPRIFTSINLKDNRLDMDYFESRKSVAAYYGLERIEYFTVKDNLTNIKSFEDLESQILKLEIEMKSPTGFGISLAYKSNPEENFTNENKIWNDLKTSKNEYRTIIFELPSDKKITNIRLDIGGENQPKFEIGKMKIGNSRHQIEVLPENFQKYFTPNSALEFSSELNTYHSLRDENNPVWPKLEETELLRNELKNFYEK